MNIDSTKTSIPSSLDELVTWMGKNPDLYQHLQIFLRRECNTGIPDFGEEFLVMSPSGFGLYRIESVDYQNGKIIISLTDTSTKEVVTHSVDINNSQPTCLYVRWKDVKNMVFNECMRTKLNDNDLLEIID